MPQYGIRDRPSAPSVISHIIDDDKSRPKTDGTNRSRFVTAVINGNVEVIMLIRRGQYDRGIKKMNIEYVKDDRYIKILSGTMTDVMT